MPSKKAKALLGGRKSPLTKGQGGRNRGGTVSVPAAINRSSRQSGRVSSSYRESERVLTVEGSAAFSTAGSIPCNPGLPGSFPWLSGHANLYDKYRINRLVYRYKNLKGSTSAGNVIMSFDYDTLDPAPATAVQATQSTHYKDGAPWRIFELSVRTDGRILFTRSGTIAGADPKTYDMGQFFVSVEGCSNDSQGYIEVDYDIDFFDKQSASSPAVMGLASIYNFSLTPSATVSGVVPLEEKAVTIEVNPLGIVVDYTNNRLIVPPGNYIMLSALQAGDSVDYKLGINGTTPGQPYNYNLAGVNTPWNLFTYIESDGTTYVQILATFATLTPIDAQYMFLRTS